MKTELYPIGIYLYSDFLFPDDYEDGAENTYYLTEEQYEQLYSRAWYSIHDIHDWLKETLSSENIYEAVEYIERDDVCLDDLMFDYKEQKYFNNFL